MPQYRRSRLEGGTYFFTVVTYDRLPILMTAKTRELLRSAWVDVRERFPFTVDAVCLLPDHLHCIWVLPEGDANFSVRWKEIKRLFPKGYLDQVGPGGIRNASRMSRCEAAIWRRRFWEHTIRDEEDLNRHRDYIHFNPVKHGLVQAPIECKYSSFHTFVKLGLYTPDWGAGEALKIDLGMGVE